MECSGCGQAFGVSNWDRLFKFSYACPNCDVINGTYKEPAAYVFAAFILNHKHPTGGKIRLKSSFPRRFDACV
jgi:hypothetical protein